MIRTARIRYIPNHKNSKGEPAPWVIVQEGTGKIISSHKTREDAKRQLKLIHIFKKK